MAREVRDRDRIIYFKELNLRFALKFSWFCKNTNLVSPPRLNHSHILVLLEEVCIFFSAVKLYSHNPFLRQELLNF